MDQPHVIGRGQQGQEGESSQDKRARRDELQWSGGQAGTQSLERSLQEPGERQEWGRDAGQWGAPWAVLGAQPQLGDVV